MPILSTISAISGIYPDIAENSRKYLFEKNLFILIGIFYPPDEPISPQMLRCGPFAVGLPQLHGPHLASAAISTRE